jgi:hypothetical protein
VQNHLQSHKQALSGDTGAGTGIPTSAGGCGSATNDCRKKKEIFFNCRCHESNMGLLGLVKPQRAVLTTILHRRLLLWQPRIYSWIPSLCRIMPGSAPFLHYRAGECLCSAIKRPRLCLPGNVPNGGDEVTALCSNCKTPNPCIPAPIGLRAAHWPSLLFELNCRDREDCEL